MAKYTRTAYATKGTLAVLANRIANESGLSTGWLKGLQRTKAGGGQRVRITILVEPEAPPKRERAAKGPRPVQLSLDVAPPAGAVVPVAGDCSMASFLDDFERRAAGVSYAIPGSAVTGGA